MNNAKIWLVVKPTVGIPLFLSAVAISSFAVHLAIISNTTWIEDYHQGLPLGTTAKVEAMAVEQADARAATVAFTPDGGSQQILVVMPDGSTARAFLERPSTLASLASEAPPVTE